MAFVLVVVLFARGPLTAILGDGFDQLTESTDAAAEDDTDAGHGERFEEEADGEEPERRVGIEMYDPTPPAENSAERTAPGGSGTSSAQEPVE